MYFGGIGNCFSISPSSITVNIERELPGFSFNDVFMNPYTPPVKSNMYDGVIGNYGYSRDVDIRGGVGYTHPPISVATTTLSSVPSIPVTYSTNGTGRSAYTQIGILTNSEIAGSDGETKILPLYGRRVDRNRFQYYTMSNTGFVNTKLPIMVGKKSGLDDYGINEIYTDDSVSVSGYGKDFKVEVYPTESLYI